MGQNIHHLPGRLRIKVLDLKDNPRLARLLQSNLQARIGIEHVEIRQKSQSIIIHYDPTRLNIEDVRGYLQLPERSSPAEAKTLSPDMALPTLSKPLSDTALHLGKVFGKTAFKVALQQTVELGVSSAMKAMGGQTLGR